MKILFFLLFALAMNIAINAQFTAPTLFIKTIDDTWVEEKNPDTNHDGETGMSVVLNNEGNSMMVYLKYKLESIADHDSFALSFVAGITD